MPTKVQALKMKKLKALSQDMLFLIEIKIPCHLFSECYTVSVIADLAQLVEQGTRKA